MAFTATGRSTAIYVSTVSIAVQTECIASCAWQGLEHKLVIADHGIAVGEPHVVTPNRLGQHFTTQAPDDTWVTDITYIKTHEGWLYLAVAVDLFFRKVVGWSMQPRITKELALNTLLMAVWRRKPVRKVIVHSDQGSQYTSHDWQTFLRTNNLLGSMSRRGNCYDNAVAESFFQLLKRERIKRQIYAT